MHLNKWFTHVAEAVSHATGHAVAFIICCVTVIIWAVTGPVFGFSDTWQFIINTGTTIVTFLMVFPTRQGGLRCHPFLHCLETRVFFIDLAPARGGGV